MSASAGNAFLNETGAEILKSFRAPEFLIPTLVMPVAFYSFFGVSMGGGPGQASYMLATYGIFAVMGPSIFGFGIGVANERDRGWLKLKQAAPAPAFSYILAKMVSTLIFSAVALAPIYAVAGFAGGVTLPLPVWMSLLSVHILAAIPFVLIGLTLGFTFPTNGAVAVANLVYLSLAALGGLWMPISMYPKALQGMAQYLPSFHLGELALFVSGQGSNHDPMQNAMAVGVMTAIFICLAILAWKRQS